MTRDEALARLEALGSERVRELNSKRGVTGDQYGVMMGDIRKLADEIKSDHSLALELWDTRILEARLLAVLLIKPKELSGAALNQLVRANRQLPVSDWLNSYVVKVHPEKEDLRQRWMESDHPMAARAGWSLTAERVAKKPDGLDLARLLDRIEAEMATADPEPQWTMNNTLAAIGINHPQHRERALAIGEALGVYRDYPTSAGCTSPFAPAWIGEMVRRQGNA
ncbi:DNA alkylation repair protein [Croceibacterium sp. LX-88]|jgi:3-methyladenine DNA glycosylase AlkD|uniref:DNA alkylation repair protein n=1 Tax=Croceibacterium selenioxidans TaxID=2838833 RepID=A0ABS5W2Y4_9SPHN|nr:DNA alkylation repair protein [Croceibacterium selenioxidans]MBT2132744.1 DNA alkylation repair protein [Croceibacterium selenioxidans]